MPKTIQIRDLDDDVYEGLVKRAAEAGITVPELLRRHARQLASRPSIDTWLARTETRQSDSGRGDVLEALEELRGERP